MPLSRLENFLINTDGNILYVNPSDLDSTDSFDNKGNSLTRPFKTIQRALIEAARFAYQSGQGNDKFDNTTILLYPGTHYVDNRPGYYIKNNSGTAQFLDVNKSVVGSPNLELTNTTEFDINNSNNVMHKLNSTQGGIIVPKGTSLVGMDLRKTKIVPLYVPDPANDAIPRSSIFRITGGCYFWQFSIFDGNRSVFYNFDETKKANPSFSHHKLTCFEYADGINVESTTGLTDLQMYYYKLMHAYGNDSGREIVNFPTSDDFEPNNPEFKIVGDLVSDDLFLSGNATSDGITATVNTEKPNGLQKNDTVRIVGLTSTTYNGRFKVTGITSERTFSYNMLADPAANVVAVTAGTSKAIVEIDNVDGASPYIFNISLRSAFGMCGMHADGNKATGFKSMVVAQFTGIGLQNDDEAFVIYNSETGNYDTNSSTDLVNRPLHLNQDAIYKNDYTNFHVKASNNAVIQAVSVFAIGFAEHFVSVNGGDQSITNSNSNFGAKSLTAKGFRKESFNRDDTGYITHIIPPKDLQQDEFNVAWKVLNAKRSGTGISTSGALYIIDESDENNPPTNISNGFRIGSKEGEILYLDVTLDGLPKTFSSKIVMQPKAGGELVASKKEVRIQSITSGTDTLTLTEPHNFIDGESVRIYSDDGILPDGIEYGRQYYVIDTGASTIKLSKTFNGAIASTPENIDIKNALGGNLRVCSTVTDKIPGEPGHPLQYDSTNGWFVITDPTFTDSLNTIHDGFLGFGTAIAANNSSTYVKRKSETRDLNDRLYRFRYVIPKAFVNAKAPEKNFIIQESKTVNDATTITDIRSHRNPRVISGITTSGFVATVTTEEEHGLSVNDVVRLKNVVSDINLDTDSNTRFNTQGFNGYFTVTEITGVRSFKFTNSQEAGMGLYVDRTHTCRDTNDSSATLEDLPVFERNEYDTTYIVEDVDQIQEYIANQQDGIYYLTVLTGNVSPTVNEFSSQKFKQSPYYLYPVVDKDNLNLDPVQSVSAASNALIGKTLVNDGQNSLTKESILNYLLDNRIGIGITGAISDNVGVATFFLAQNHKFSPVKGIDSITAAGSGYGVAGITTTLYNVTTTVSPAGGDGCTANLTCNASQQVTGVEIVSGGCAYVDGATLTFSGAGGGNATAEILVDDDQQLKTVEVVGVGTTASRNNSTYNGLFRVSNCRSPKQIECSVVGPEELAFSSLINHGSNPGVFVAGGSQPMLYTTGDRINLNGDIVATGTGSTTSFSGIATVTTLQAHGLSVGNRIKVSNVTGTARTVYAGKSFTVQKIVTNKKFVINTPFAINTSGTAVGMVYKHGIGAFGEDTSLTTEKISGRLISMMDRNMLETLTNNIAVNTVDIVISDNKGFKIGDFLQIDDEIVRIQTINANGVNIVVIRGVLGSKSAGHAAGSIIKSIKVIPSEVRRFSSIRASGHTFEYIGYGPGNYSTALPQKQVRVISQEEEFLAISKEQKGGVTFFSGMNDRGEFFTWDGRIVSRENFLGEVGSDASNVFDDLYVRNTLRVGGGPNQNLPSEFRGPVNFINKITSTSVDGIDAIKLILKGTSISDPFFQVGPDASPSLIVNQATQFVGIKTATPAHELDVSGTIRADVYENFKLSDLPNTRDEEVTFGRNRILKVNDKGDGYELVDTHEIDSYALRSYGISNDGTVYTGIGTVITTAAAKALAVGSGTTLTSSDLDTKLGANGAIQITGIATSRFFVGESCKVFGATPHGTSALISDPDWNLMTATKTGSTSGSAKAYYWVAQYNLNDGRVGISSQITSTTVVSLPALANFNDLDHVTLNLDRTDTNHGLLIYRQYSAGGGDSANILNSKLIGILGPKEFNGTETANVNWKDYGNYDQVDWTFRGTHNEYDEDQIHFPNIATTGQRRGFGVGEVIAIGSSSITLSESLIRFNDSQAGFGTTSIVKVVHENTDALSRAVDDTVESGGNYLDLPSGTYLTNKLVIPTAFTIRGNGKNTIIKRQFFANDGDGQLVGIGTTAGRDITLVDFTIDGNSGNNIKYGEVNQSSDSYLVYLPSITSTDIKNVEIRNSSENGLWIKDSTRLSIDGCAIVDGGQTDRYQFTPINAQESTVLRIHDSLFENYSAAVDVSATEVTATGGNIIRNCGTGIKIFASGKISTKDNIILGPSDEHIPSPDIYDSDWDSVNVSIDPTVNLKGPMFLYIRDGNPYNIAENAGVKIISAGIGTIIGTGTTNESLATAFEQFDINTVDDDGDLVDRANGYLKIDLTAAKTVGFSTRRADDMGYQIVAEEYLQKPTGISTIAGISTGAWYKTGSATIGTGVTNYLVTLETPAHYQAFSVDQIVKLVNHQATPVLSSQLMVLEEKISVSSVIKQLRFRLVDSNLSGITTTSVSNAVGGYISIRDRFVIAKGRVGVI